MEHSNLQEFRIYPSIESYKTNSNEWIALTGHISFEKGLLIASDGKEYRLNYNKYSLNNPWDDLDFNVPISTVVWFIPLDVHKWHIGSVKADQYYAYKKSKEWIVLRDRDTEKSEDFKPLEIKRTFRRCLKVIRKDGDLQVMRCFVWETPKFFVQQIGHKKVRFSKMTKPVDTLPAAFIDDEDGISVKSYIFPT